MIMPAHWDHGLNNKLCVCECVFHWVLILQAHMHRADVHWNEWWGRFPFECWVEVIMLQLSKGSTTDTLHVCACVCISEREITTAHSSSSTVLKWSHQIYFIFHYLTKHYKHDTPSVIMVDINDYSHDVEWSHMLRLIVLDASNYHMNCDSQLFPGGSRIHSKTH